MMDAAEAWANAVLGLAVSAVLVALLRAVGLWDAPALAVSAFFFVASFARAWGLRCLFRWWEGRGTLKVNRGRPVK